jgi:EAL domain-containing protein (putative c-di-GMP-specific phosphodiesterase class I)
MSLEVIFGASLVLVAHKDITEGFKDIAHRLLKRYNILSDVTSPSFGLWFVPFSIRRSDIPADPDEQIKALTAAGKQLVRTMLQENFGMATGTKVDFKLAVIPIPEGVSDPDRINSYIRTSLYQHASAGKQYATISPEEFKKIIDTRSIDIYLQPIVSLSQENIVGYEALSRGPANSPIYQAADLFGTASHFGLREELEMACISKALDWAMKLPEPYWMSINIGPNLITRQGFYDLITRQDLNDLLSRIVFEITEHIPIPTAERLQRTVHDIRELGIRLALDDTGCGFADIDTVRFLRPDIVKICISIIRRIGKHPYIERDIRLTVDRITQFGADVLGEGVERRVEVDVLKDCQVSLAQGYYYGRPEPAEHVLKAKQS